MGRSKLGSYSIRARYLCRAAILCSGTYLRSRCIYGDVSNPTGPNGLQAANHLSKALIRLGIELVRFKTGTPARIDGRTIDYSKMEEQKGDENIVTFSFTTDRKKIQKRAGFLLVDIHEMSVHMTLFAVILDRSPLYSGVINGTGPRYCPSIEDKVVRFADKSRHQLFIEPEGLSTNEMYVEECQVLCRKMYNMR